jgi:hypothetical protein
MRALSLIREFLWSLWQDIPPETDDHYRAFCRDMHDASEPVDGRWLAGVALVIVAMAVAGALG